MNTRTFKTDIKCSGCVAKVTPHLNALAGEFNWNVDIFTPSKILTVEADVTEEQVREAVAKAGFKAEAVQP